MKNGGFTVDHHLTRKYVTNYSNPVLFDHFGTKFLHR